MIRLAVSRPVSTLVATGTLVVLGVFALARLPVALLPAIDRPSLVVKASAPDRSREEILQGLTEPMERRLTLLPGITSLQAEVEDGACTVTALAEWSADADQLRTEAARLLEGVGSFAVDSLTVEVAGTERTALLGVAVVGGAGPGVRTAYASGVLAPELARLPGAGQLEIVGGAPGTVVVRLLPAALAARALTAGDVIQRLEVALATTSAGQARDGASVRALVAREAVSSPEDLRALRVQGPNGMALLGDVAEVTTEDLSDGTGFRLDGADGVVVLVHRAPGANAVALARAVRHLAEGSTASLGQSTAGLRLEVVGDRSGEVVSAVSELGLAGLLGILLGTLVLRFLLRRWLPTLALALVIPVSVLGSLVAFDVAGVPLDVISLAGLALAVGMLVDSSIVVLEAIEAAREAHGEEASVVGTRQVAMAVAVSVATTVVVFVPLLYVRGLARAFFGEQAFAVVATLSVSLALSLTLTPVLAGRSRVRLSGRQPGRAAYLRLLDAALARPVLAVLLAVVVSGASLASIAVLPLDLLPEASARTVRVEYRLAPDRVESAVSAQVAEFEQVLRQALEAHGLQRLVHVRGGGQAPAGVATSGRIDAELRTEALALAALAAVREAVAGVAGVSAEVGLRPSAVAESLGDSVAGIEVVVSALDEPRLEALAVRVAALMEEVTGLPVSRPDDLAPRAAVAVRLRLDRLAQVGLAPAELVEQARAALTEREVGRLVVGGIERPVRVRGEETMAAGEVPVRLPAGERQGTQPAPRRRVAPLSALAELDIVARPARLHRENGRPALRLEVASASGTATSASATSGTGTGGDAFALARALQRLPLGQGERVRLAGRALEMQATFLELGLAFLLAIALVFLTITAAYESAWIPLLVMVTVPVACGGGFVLLGVSGQGLNLMSLLGLVLLAGIAVNNAIVLIDRAEGLRRLGRAPAAAVREAAGERYRPVLMTTLTTFAAMLPLALLPGEGSQLRAALATAVLGGLVTSFAASLLLVPVLHVALARFRRPPGVDQR